MLNPKTAYVDDIDAFGEVIKTQSVQLMQVGQGKFKGSLTSFVLGRGVVVIGSGTNEYISEGAYSPGVITLAMLLETNRPSLVMVVGH